MREYDSYISSYPNRTLCDVLAEMRKCFSTYNFSPILGLCNEAQILGNRMESALYDKKDIKDYTEIRANLKKEIKSLKKSLKNLKEEMDEQKEESGCSKKDSNAV